MLNFMCLFIIMSISVKRHELWCTVRDMRLSKCLIIMIIIIIYKKNYTLTYHSSQFLIPSFSAIEKKTA